MNSICICGLDHSKPLPESFEDKIPIIHTAGTNNNPKAICHVCHGQWGLHEKPKHKTDCEYLMFKKNKRIKGI